MAHVKDIDSLYNSIGYVVPRAPDRFPTEGYLPTDQQMTLERAFAELRRGAMLVKADAPDLPDVDKLEIVLDEAPCISAGRTCGVRIVRKTLKQ